MGYNRENFNKIRQEYEDKYRKARETADRRRFQIHTEIPEIAKIDRLLENTGMRIMSIICSGASDSDEKISRLRRDNIELIEKRRALLLEKGYPTDYTDVKYECELCSDSGYVGTKMCECMRTKLVLAGYESSGMSRLMKEQNFDNFSLDFYSNSRENYQKMSDIFKTMKAYAEDFQTDIAENLALFGGTGLGKTHLSSAVAGKLIERGFDVLYTGAVTMLSDFENRRFGTGQVEETCSVDRYTECELLIIDDLGTEVVNQFTVSCIYNVINTRLNRKLPTIISTNLTPADFRQKYWDRITSRVLGEYRILLFSGVDVRAQKLKLQ